MEDQKCFCINHKKGYTQYCDICEEAFCDDCEGHDKGHPLVPLLSALRPEKFAEYLKDTEKTITMIDWGLHLLPDVVESLMDPSKAEKEKDVLNPLAGMKEDYTTKAKSEEHKNELLQALAVIIGKYENIKILTGQCLEKLTKVKDSVNSRYDGKISEAYEVLTIIKGVPQTLNSCMTELAELEGKVETITSVNIFDEVWLINTFKKLNEYITSMSELVPKLAKLTEDKIEEYTTKIPEIGMGVLKYEGLCKVSDKLNKSIRVLGEKRIKEIDVAIDKLEQEILKLEYSVNTPEENAKKAKKKEDELEAAEEKLAILKNICAKSNTEIKPIPMKLREANKKLSDIMRKRIGVLEKATRYFERAKANKEWIVKMLTTHKEEIENELESLIIYKSLDVVLALSTTEKRITLTQVTKRIDQIKRQHEKLNLQLLNKKAEINRIGEHLKTAKNDSNEFQISINDMQVGMIALTLNDIEKSKKDVKESKKVQRSQLMNIINTLISVEDNIEQSIAQIVEDFKDCKKMPRELENDLKQLVERAMSSLLKVKSSLEKEFKGKGAFYLMCEDGKPGKVQLVCGHLMCYKCFFNRKSKGDERLIACNSCGGVKQEIGFF